MRSVTVRVADHGEVEIRIAWLQANPSPAIEKLESIKGRQ
jgi:hypothetical protein